YSAPRHARPSPRSRREARSPLRGHVSWGAQPTISRPRWQGKRGTSSDRGRGVGAARKLGRHLAQAKRRLEAPPELRAPEERGQLRELPREPPPQGAVEAAHHGPARRPEPGPAGAPGAAPGTHALVPEEA